VGDHILEMIGLRATGIPDLDDIPSATHWPSIPTQKAEVEWQELRTWVEQLQRRFAHLDHHTIPPCWWQHNEHVEALAALRDHERVSYLPAAPATAPVEWMRALRDIEFLLHSWTAEYPCGASHQEPPARFRHGQFDGWDDHLASDVKRRAETAARHNKQHLPPR
jgi:hypothetical protein